MREKLVTRSELAADPLTVARRLLGCVLTANEVAARIIEVEAYLGVDDPASHSYRGRTERNAIMWGPAGHLYVYFVYGMHYCANVVAEADGVAGAVLLRAGEIVDGRSLAYARRPSARTDADLGRGPARLATALDLTRADNGLDLVAPDSPVRLLTGKTVPDQDIRTGPRVGIAVAEDLPWRFWVADSPAVSAYRRGGKRRTVPR